MILGPFGGLLISHVPGWLLAPILLTVFVVYIPQKLWRIHCRTKLRNATVNGVSSTPTQERLKTSTIHKKMPTDKSDSCT